jgi:hypothetical protein
MQSLLSEVRVVHEVDVKLKPDTIVQEIMSQQRIVPPIPPKDATLWDFAVCDGYHVQLGAGDSILATTLRVSSKCSSAPMKRKAVANLTTSSPSQSKKKRGPLVDISNDAGSNNDAFEVDSEPMEIKGGAPPAGANIVTKGIFKPACAAIGLGPLDHGGLTFKKTRDVVRAGIRGQTMLDWK